MNRHNVHQNMNMHAYLDDSGDGGFKFESGSTSHLVMALCVFNSTEQLELLSERLDVLATKHRRLHEFRYSKTKDSIKDDFFETIGSVEFKVRAIVLNKQFIYSRALRSSASAFKNYAIKELLKSSVAHLNDTKLFIDGNDIVGFGMKQSDYLLREINGTSAGSVSYVRHVNSQNSRPVQLADMIAGAINRAFSTNKPSDKTHLNTFLHRTVGDGNIWHFK